MFIDKRIVGRRDAIDDVNTARFAVYSCLDEAAAA
jgi:hypothetical protein